jgi:prephenate dehydrogenase/chorismate mutase
MAGLDPGDPCSAQRLSHPGNGRGAVPGMEEGWGVSDLEERRAGCMDHDLMELREQVAALDKAFIELLERRFRLVAEVGRIKAARGQAVAARDVERQVLQRARDAAALCGTSPEVMEAIFAAIIRASIERQHRVGVEMGKRGGQRVLVLGAAGGMGSWVRKFLTNIGHEADGVDPVWQHLPPAPGHFGSLDAVVAAGELHRYSALIVSVPLEAAATVLADLATRSLPMPVVEIASIKSHLAPSLAALDAAGTPVASIHPMFGPGKNVYEPLTVVHAVVRDEARERGLILDLLAHPYLDLVSVPLERHDRLMGWLLGLGHLTAMLFAGALSRSGHDPGELERVASTTYARQVGTARSVLEEDPRLYFAIQRLNPFRGQVYAAVTAALAELAGAVEGDDPEAFAAFMSRGARALPQD